MRASGAVGDCSIRTAALQHAGPKDRRTPACAGQPIRASMPAPLEGGKEMAIAKPVPDGYRTLTPYLIVADGADAIAFYQRAFDARLRLRLDRPDGKIGHAELAIGDSVVMVADEYPAHGARGPAAYGGSPVGLHLYVADADAVAARAIHAGARLVDPVADKFYGDRLGTIEDPFGHRWYIATHIEDLTPDEIGRRAAREAGT
jgi:PhnB protein